MIYRFLTAMTFVCVASTASADAYFGTCHVEIDNATIAQGSCDVFVDEDTGDFTVYPYPAEEGDPEYGIAVYVGTGEAILKEVSNPDSDERPLGTLTQDAHCWTNDTARVCAQAAED
ncbi:hypothetical protein [Yoonia sp. I 8.24]|uniref:hypothetical protein n=1 Tax=Yoonia sp. I 8.24 TaxID=1537229 RepID=UPI001EDD67BC|nr:hypothetical protein [Yoonia sp. I 8.24]MCG3268261.1 hypothetical protein [Yoonia sp. I 8.24]